MWTHEDTERTYLGTEVDILLRSRLIGENVFSALPKAGLRICLLYTSDAADE